MGHFHGFHHPGSEVDPRPYPRRHHRHLPPPPLPPDEIEMVVVELVAWCNDQLLNSARVRCLAVDSEHETGADSVVDPLS